MDKELRSAFLNKEKVELYLSNLEKLHEDDTIRESSYNLLKSEYSSNLKQALAKVEAIKQDIEKKLKVRKHELEVFQQELANLDARFKVGQFSADTYLRLSKKPERKVAYLETQVAHLTSLVNAKRSSDIQVAEASGMGSAIPRLFGTQTMPQALNMPDLPSDYTTEEAAPPPVRIPDGTSISNMIILPDRVLPGSTIGIMATITNNSQDIVYHQVEFKINGKIECIKDVVLNPGQNEELTFITIAGAPGEYTITIDNVSGILHVLSASNPAATSI